MNDRKIMLIGELLGRMETIQYELNCLQDSKLIVATEATLMHPVEDCVEIISAFQGALRDMLQHE